MKRQILKLMREIWKSEKFQFTDTSRSRHLRRDLLTRFLSFVMTDDERAKLYGLPDGCRMRENAKIISPEKFSCGEFVWIGEGVIVDASGGLEIGSHTTVGSGSYIWTHSSAMSNIMMDNRSGNPYIIRKRTVIGEGVFIGGPSVVYPGVTIGNRCIILPMSVITEDVPSNTMMGGAPARPVRQIDERYIKRYIDSLTDDT